MVDAPGPASHPAHSPASVSVPLFFEPNQGQTDTRVKFLARGPGYGLFLTDDEAVLSLRRSATKGKPARANVVRMRLDGATPAASIRGSQPLPGKSNYFIGNDPGKWRTSIPQFASVEYQRVYPGIDLVYYGNQQQLEYDFRISPGADPNHIALSFQGASARLESGDLILSTSNGDVRFHAPRIYQPADSNPPSADAHGRIVSGGFRLLGNNKVGFVVGPYDRSRELVIDPLLSYSTYLGGGGESLVTIAVDSAQNIYVAGSTTSADFPVTSNAIQSTLVGTQNIFISILSPLAGAGSAQLLFSTYLGGSGTDSLGGVAVDPGQLAYPSINMYVAGTTTSPNFPTTASNAFQPTATFTPGETHGFLSTINASVNASGVPVLTLSYSTYLAGNGNDGVTGIAVDLFHDAYVTGTTTSTNILTGFPSTPNAFQICPWQPAQSGGNPCPVTSGPTQFFASEVNTAGSGTQSMLYSTFYGGAYPSNAVATGGGIAVDTIPNNPLTNVNMYFTGTTNMPGVMGPNPGNYPFPLFNALQACLNESGVQNNCGTPGTNTDAFVVKLNPNRTGAIPSYSTYLGGSGNDTGNAIAVDVSANTYITGATNSSDWVCTSPCTPEPAPYNAYTGTSGNSNAFIAKIGNEANQIFPLTFFAYAGGSGPDTGNAIAVDSVQATHVAGTTASTNLPVLDPYQATYGGGPSDAFVVLMSTTLFSSPNGNYVTYLGGSGLDQGTGIALDNYGNAYIGGSTQSPNFPIDNPYQSGLIGTQDAFVTTLSGNSQLYVASASGSPSPNPVPAGTQVTFTANITNKGPDPASNVIFTINVPTSGLQTLPSAVVVSSGTGSCTNGLNGTIVCNVGSLAVGATSAVAIFLTPAIPQVAQTLGVSGSATANNGQPSNKWSQSANITDFTITAVNTTPEIKAGALAVINVALTPNQTFGYNGSIGMTWSSSPSIVTSPSPTFTVTPVLLSGTAQAQTTLNMQTVPRPVNSGSLFRRKAFYAAWVPIAGLSLIGLGVGASRKRRRWFVGALLGLIAALVLLLPSCSSGSSAVIAGGGTQAGIYFITITGNAGTGAAHQVVVQLQVD